MMLRRAAPALFAWVALAWASAHAAPPIVDAPTALERTETGAAVLIDVRTREEWRDTGVAAGARTLALQDPDFLGRLHAYVEGERTRPVLLICRTGRRSAYAGTLLQRAGFTQIFNVAEGMAGSSAGPGWLARGLALESYVPERHDVPATSTP
ncbi:MAG: rhodanese-like domain-containing protein [Pseudomonadota bacterium]